MSELGEKVRKSIKRLKVFEPPEGYYLAFSGGKDSVVVKALCDMAGVKHDATYRVTSVDPPELVQFIMDAHPDVNREIPKDKDGLPVTMWNLIPKKLILPTRRRRYCCADLKETGGIGRLTVTGVRWAESVNRTQSQGILQVRNVRMTAELEYAGFLPSGKGGLVLMNDNGEARRMTEHCYQKNKTLLNPIIDWTTAEVWQFIRAERVPYCGLYDEGWHRLGCIGCSMASRNCRVQEFIRWSNYNKFYLRAIEKMMEERERRGLARWRCNGVDRPDATAEEIFDWWMERAQIEGQTSLFDEGGL